MKLIKKAGKTKLIISKKEYDEINKKAAFVNRDPFARQELHKEVVQDTKKEKTCDNCGQQKKLYKYRVEEDSISGKKSIDNKSFCSK